jgi:hypothetical protein
LLIARAQGRERAVRPRLTPSTQLWSSLEGVPVVAHDPVTDSTARLASDVPLVVARLAKIIGARPAPLMD